MELLILLLLPFVAAVLGVFIGESHEKIRDAMHVFVSFIMLCWVIALYPLVEKGDLSFTVNYVMGTGLHLKVGMLQYFMIALTSVLWLLVTIYSPYYLTKHKNRNRYYLCFMLTYGFVLGIFMSENLLNLFTFFEAMTFSSYILIIHDEDAFSHRAGYSYLAMAISGGLVMLMGILVAFDYTDTLIIAEVAAKMPSLDVGIQRLIALLIVIGFGVKSSMFPLHTWLPGAYVASPTPATAVLSGVLLKTGLYGMLLASVVLVQDSFISSLMIALGIVNALLGGFLALNQRNIKRLVAYSSMSQAGYMIIAIGLIGLLGHEGGLALSAATLFMVNHGVAKVLLFLGVGMIVYWVKELSLTHIWGIAYNQTFLKVVFAIAALGTIGIPGFNGFASKTLLHEAILELSHGHPSLWASLLEPIYYLASGLTVAYLIKLYEGLFLAKNPVYTAQPKRALNYKAVIPTGLLAAAVLVLGLMPEQFLLPLVSAQEAYHMEAVTSYHLYSLESFMSVGYVLAIGILVYGLYVKRRLVVIEGQERTYINQTINWFNIETDFYRPFFGAVVKVFTKVFDFIDTWMTKVTITAKYFLVYISNLDATLLKKLEWDRTIIDRSTSLGQYEIEDDLTLSKKPQTIKESFSSFYFNITSINYNVLFVGSILVIIMAILYLAR